MIGKIDTVAVWAILVLTLALSVVLGLITPYALAALGVILLVSRIGHRPLPSRWSSVRLLMPKRRLSFPGASV